MLLNYSTWKILLRLFFSSQKEKGKYESFNICFKAKNVFAYTFCFILEWGKEKKRNRCSMHRLILTVHHASNQCKMVQSKPLLHL